MPRFAPASGRLRIGTRPSRLARAQARLAVDALVAAGVADPMELVTIETHGDRVSARHPRGGFEQPDGQFTSALEAALRDDRIDVAVHSFKDLPTASDGSLAIAAVLERGDPRDCLLTRAGGGLTELPFGGRVGTSSPRRAAQLAAVRPDIVAAPIRGNVDTRLARLERGEYDGLLLAAAGLLRLEREIPEAALLPLEVMLPAPAQGALVLQTRGDDHAVLEAVSGADHPGSRIAAEAERALLRRLGGGCLATLGTLAEVDGDGLRLRAAFEEPGGFHRVDLLGRATDPAELVERAAAELMSAAGVTA